MRGLQKNSGFTLIEVMIAIAIIAIGIFGVMSLVLTVMKGNTLSKRVTTATTIAQDKLEYLKRIDYNEIDLTGVSYSGTETTYDIDYYRQVTIDDNTPAADTRTITVDVYWDPGTTTSTHKVELKTVIAE
jgi:type IV pilus assembly protein PilV